MRSRPCRLRETVPDGSAPSTSGNTAPRGYVPFRTDKWKTAIDRYGFDLQNDFVKTQAPGRGRSRARVDSEPPKERSTTAFIRDPRSLTHKAQILECDKLFALTSDPASTSLVEFAPAAERIQRHAGLDPGQLDASSKMRPSWRENDRLAMPPPRFWLGTR